MNAILKEWNKMQGEKKIKTYPLLPIIWQRVHSNGIAIVKPKPYFEYMFFQKCVDIY